MTPDQRNYLSMSRSDHLFAILRTSLFVLAANAGFIHFGPEGYSAPLTMLAIAAGAFGIIAGRVALDDIAALRDDMSDEMKATHMGRALAGRNFAALKAITSALIGLTVLAELYAIFV
ncbi:hypothetical protein [Albidovulum sediminis]|uniref:Uncharacterized protein n=1 Tax=Albidovulum sediminis TaxID=3066345 RepID=A0ABT2NGG7_9RHOB|nr:hypothetical protein [Defluviimonas sediminis]MCT8328015.1 hypothetical protein [Defluviimonas sediminis]